MKFTKNENNALRKRNREWGGIEVFEPFGPSETFCCLQREALTLS